MILQKIKIVAYWLGGNIDIKKLKQVYVGKIHSGSSTEIFIKKGDCSYICVQNYGDVSFSDCDEKSILEFISFLKPFIDVPVLTGK